ncbi:MAG: TonB-dependent receptor [Caulobacteraceae bacterium]|nr:TonB-dependent receptor [Caulobacter sp.]
MSAMWPLIVRAQSSAAGARTEPPPAESEVVVTGRLDAARDRIAPSLGAVTYTIGQDQIAATPQGENAAFNQVLLRAPGVVLDSFGEEHVRGEHGGLTYRINGVLLPEGLNGFGQELDSRIIRSVSLITGALPAQFGFRTAGIVDVTAKSGGSLKGNEASLYGGGYQTVEPSLQLGGSDGRTDVFAVGSYTHDGVGIENPVGTWRPIHDDTDQGKLFGYASRALDAASRISLLGSLSYATFELPDTPGLQPRFSLAGTGPVSSSSVNERQVEENGYLLLSYQKSAGMLDLQVSPYLRYGAIRFTPDPDRDLVFQGTAGKVLNAFATGGVQVDAAYALNAAHTLRAGLLAQYTDEVLRTTTRVFATDAAGGQASTLPVAIFDRSGNYATEAGVYLQDEWRLTPALTLNYGARYDGFQAAFDKEGQLSPRANLVWTPASATTLHLGYSRYFAPPSAQYVPPSTLARFAGTTNAPEVFTDTPTHVERSNYYDVGVQRRLLPGWQVTADGFYKDAQNLGDLGQFGAAVILSPFSYRIGHVFGGELSSTYAHGPWSAFANFSYVDTSAKDINSAEYQFPADELAYIETHAIKLDHEGEYTLSAGGSYSWRASKAYVDLLYGYGLRAGFANLDKEPSYVVVNIGAQHALTSPVSDKPLTLRVDVTNLLDARYQIRDGSGLGISAAQYGQRLGLFFGLAQTF